MSDRNATMSSSRSSNNCAIMKRSLPKRPSPSVSRNMSRRSTGISTRTSLVYDASFRIDWRYHATYRHSRTAAELNGDTAVAQSVVDLANAVNDVSAAYRHTGAADAVNEVIRTIEQRGTSGLVAELNKRAGEEQQRGAKDLQCPASRSFLRR